MAWDKEKKKDERTIQFAKNLILFAKNNDITVKELCKAIDFKPSNIYRWKTGTVAISMDSIDKIQGRLSTEFERIIDFLDTSKG